MRPLIGITASILREPPAREWMYNTTSYFEAIQEAGGIPVLLPFCQNQEEAGAILDRLDGLLLSGGADVDPLHFGEQPHQRLGKISPERDTTELALARVALQRNMPILGICRGHQVLAVAAGAKIVQDIPAQVPGAIKHAQEAPRWYPTHTVTAKEGTRLASLLGTEFRTNSYHHQSVKDLPEGWVSSAETADGINEAMEHPGYKFVLSVQWHPEEFTGHDYNFRPIFTAFIEACKS